MTIAAVPCLGLDDALSENGRVVAGLRSYVAANRPGPVPGPVSPPATSMGVAGALACNNQGR